MKVEFEVKPSAIHGRGLFTKEAIPARRKIGEFAGERIRLREARRRARERKIIAIIEFEDGWALDGSVGGNGFRYMNHSCTPNTYMRLANGRCEFYSLRAIRAGEELTCSYGETQHNGKLQCKCQGECAARL
jgi:SET domain-containing protein